MNLTSIPIITYHQIVSNDRPEDPWNLTVSVRQFERQIRYIHERGYHCFSLTELLRSSGEDQPLRRKSVVLTFDDGYENFLSIAYPILRRYGFTAIVFLITDCVGKRSDRMFEKGVPFLSWDQVKSLHKDGISFGSHTCSHPDLAKLSETQVWHELVSSKECLEDRLGARVQLLAYPHGHSNREIQHKAEAAGYEAACGMSRGRRSRFNLWRTLCHTKDTLNRFAFQLTKWPYYARWLREETVVGQFIRTVKHEINR
jgi:peptidoglycan/xylan/chitin deacetylase (PgdA/CDA1 family)